jgi:GTPase SAR1 family protein
MFDWDAEYQSIVEFYAKLALNAGWRDYIRGVVKEKMDTEPLFKTLGKDVAKKIKELEKNLSTTKEDHENTK